jgi:pimeloyl-ACP methyl ester carboxylesterase
VATIELTGFTCAYDDRGRGTPVAWIHGFPLHREMWVPQLVALADACRMIALDLRGFGESGRTAGPYRMEGYADDVAALLDALKIEKAIIAGLSMGGYVAFELCRRHAKRVSGLLLADTKAEPDTPEARAGRRELAERVRSQGVGVLVQELLPRLLSETTRTTRPEVVQRVRAMIEAADPQSVGFALAGMAERLDANDLLPEIRIPTCVVVGEEDAIAPPETARLMGMTIPGARVVVIRGAGHVSNLENPDAFNAAARDLIARVR